jgi:hypothetical protein
MKTDYFVSYDKTELETGPHVNVKPNSEHLEVGADTAFA